MATIQDLYREVAIAISWKIHMQRPSVLDDRNIAGMQFAVQAFEGSHL